MKLLPTYFRLKQNFSKFLLGRFDEFKKQRRLASRQKKEQEIRSIYQNILWQDIYSKTQDQALETVAKPIVENVFVTQAGVLVFYHLKLEVEIKVYSMLFETAHPKRMLWNFPRLIIQFSNQHEEWKFIRLDNTEGRYQAHWHSSILGAQIKVYPSYRFEREIKLRYPMPELKKSAHNPMIKPRHKNPWEAFTTFNPAAFFAADKVHILYRAQGYDYISKVGYATSKDGQTIENRLSHPVYQASQDFEGTSFPPGDPDGKFASGGGSGGIEDPRTTIIGDKVYMTYVAYDGWSAPRVAMTSILLSDFLDEKFLWERPVLISEPGVVDKSACIFPEKINGKYVIIHRVFPNILIDYVDDLDFNGRKYLKGEYKLAPRSREWWDSRKIGAGAPPIKTDEGWLLIYQAVDDKDASEYKVGAMLLDLEDPTKILYRSQQPIMLPREDYENYGFKAGVIYPCGAIVKDDTLYVYYGGADSYVCVAVANLPEFLRDLKKTGVNHLDPTVLQMSE